MERDLDNYKNIDLKLDLENNQVIVEFERQDGAKIYYSTKNPSQSLINLAINSIRQSLTDIQYPEVSKTETKSIKQNNIPIPIPDSERYDNNTVTPLIRYQNDNK